MSQRTHAKAETNAAANPTPKAGSDCADRSVESFHNEYPVAAKSVGIARKNENSVAATRDMPNSMPPMIVAPERDVPGNSANACAHPTFRASVQRMSSIVAMRIVPG